MLAVQVFALAFFAQFGTQLASAASLYVPLLNVTDGAPISVDVEGVDDTGHTTWVVQLGAPSGTFTATDVFLAPGTLVADATTAHFVENVPSGLAATIDCGINNGQAACVAVASILGTATTVTTTQPVIPVEVQAASIPTSSPPLTDAAGATTMPTPTSVQSGSTGATGATGPSSSQKPHNGAGQNAWSAFGYAMVGIVAGHFAQ
ncbi:hypothetical protein PYCCODRAFT_1476658 [Trametes coccinea BRFM310]|uniref:Uncharacterized protein n=1 Tax=Trametes coccinea (strain BRFM310) TaxID=1353009 RepID=A0A1Y2ISP4_TRAC3|nr:hypothetical protein PYCCODRAFT_1476658 [Trametes coccinea BRFM310]